MKIRFIFLVSFVILLFALTGCASTKQEDSLEVLKNSDTDNVQEDISEEEVTQFKNQIKDLENEIAKKDELILQKDTETKKLLEKYDRSKELSIYADVEDLLFWLVVRFDHAWVAYINIGDEDIFNYMIEDSQIYDLAIKFKQDHPNIKERVPQIWMQDVEISEDSAKIYVHEEVEERNGGANEIKAYDWVYYAKKIDNIWYLEQMVKE